nr:mechanosensitive ion channel family protein [Pseudenhygromyxa sp. WMMC2535]
MKGTTFFVGVILTWLLVRAYDAVHQGLFLPYARRPETAIDLHVFSVLQTVVSVLLWAIGLASALASIGFEVTAVLAGLGIGGVAIALASQDTVSNFFGGLIVLTQRPFKVGDRIAVAGVDGWVQHLGFRTTIIKNWYGRDITVPNTQFTNSMVTNIDSQSCYYFEVRPRLDPRTTPAQLVEALKICRQVVLDHQDMLDEISWEAVDKIGHGYIEVEFWYAVSKWSPDERERFPNEYQKQCMAKTAVNLELLRRFEAAGIVLALPMDVHWNVEVERGAGPTRLEPPQGLRLGPTLGPTPGQLGGPGGPVGPAGLPQPGH